MPRPEVGRLVARAVERVGGAGEPALIEDRCRQRRDPLRNTASDNGREKRRERLVRFAGGLAAIRVGAPTEADLKSRKDAFDDALGATKAAVAEGTMTEVEEPKSEPLSEA